MSRFKDEINSAVEQQADHSAFAGVVESIAGTERPYPRKGLLIRGACLPLELFRASLEANSAPSGEPPYEFPHWAKPVARP